jgi:hypothetical protein
MADRPDLIEAAFGDILPIAEVLKVEGDRLITLEYVGLDNHLGERRDGQPRTRGAHFTSGDAAIRYRRPDGETPTGRRFGASAIARCGRATTARCVAT